MRNYTEVLDYLYSRLPMFTRVGKAAYKADLSNTLALMELLGHPERAFKSVHIAGTNGKGSSSHLLASVLQEAGYRTGLCTSPHIHDFRERIRIQGVMIPESFVIDFVLKHREAFEAIQPSFFEWSIALCFYYFAEQQPDIAVIETGLGGRLDSTNVIEPAVSLITNISFDHMDLLGDTLPKIAVEKAGIIKTGIPVVIGSTQSEVKQVFDEKAAAFEAPIHYADRIFRSENIQMSLQGLTTDIYSDDQLIYPNLFCALPGLYQQWNIPGVLTALQILKQQGFATDERVVRAGFEKVKVNTGFWGRWEVLSEKPVTIADTGHNEAGIAAVMQQIKTITYQKLYIVFGMVNDKSPDKVLRLLPTHAEYFFCRANMPRALDDKELCQIASTYGLRGKAAGSVQEAFAQAKAKAGPDDMIYVGGSTFVAAEIL